MCSAEISVCVTLYYTICEIKKDIRLTLVKIRIHIQAKENLLNSFIGRYTFLRKKLNMDKNLIINIWQFFAAILCAVLKYQFVQVHI